MPLTLPSQLTVEKTPSYFVRRDVPQRIRAFNPDVKLLVVVRDPVTRALSDYTQQLAKRPWLKSFAEMAFPNSTLFNNLTASNTPVLTSTQLPLNGHDGGGSSLSGHHSSSNQPYVDTHWGAIKIGLYAEQLNKWFAQGFKLSQFLFISGEALIRTPLAEMKMVEQFLGLSDYIRPSHFYFNETKGFPCVQKRRGDVRYHCLGKTKGRLHPKVPLVVLKQLRRFYEKPNRQFFQLVRRNFGWSNDAAIL